MTFVQKQEITMVENVGYTNELIAYYFYKGPSHTVYFVGNWCDFVLISTGPLEECILWSPFIVCHGDADVLTMVIVHHFGL